MPVLPNTYSRRRTASSQRGVRGYNTSASGRGERANADALASAGRDIGSIADERYKEKEREGRNTAQEARTRKEVMDKSAILNAQERENTAQRSMLDLMYGTDDTPGLYQAKGSDALNAESTFEDKWKKIKETGLNGVENGIAKRELEKSFQNMYETTLGNVKRYRNAESDKYFAGLSQDTISLENNRVRFEYNNDDTFAMAEDKVRKSANNLAMANGVDATPLINQQISSLYQSKIIGMLSSNDASIILDAQDVYDNARKRGKIKDFTTAMKIEKALASVVPDAAAKHIYDTKTYKAMKTDKADIISFIVNDIEGGDEIAQEPDGAIAKYGINSEANPNVDVANLDEAGANALNDKRWKDFMIDDVPEDMKLIAFDTAFNHRRDFAQNVVEKIRSGATPNEVLDLRLKEYQRLVKANPKKYGKYYNGWKNRLEKISDQMVGGAKFDEKKIYKTAENLDKRYKGAGKALIDLYNADQKLRAEAKKAAKTSVQDQVIKYNSQNNGDYSNMPADLKAQAALMNIDVTQYKGVSDRETVDELDIMTSDQLSNVDLDDPIYAQNLTFDDLQSYKEQQQKLSQPESKYLKDKIDGVVGYFYRSELNKNPDDKKVKADYANMNRYVQFEAQKIFEKNGKVTDKELSDLSKDFFKNRIYDPGILSGEIANVYSMPVKDIPADIRKAIEVSLANEGKLTTDESVRQRYILHLRRQGQIEEAK